MVCQPSNQWIRMQKLVSETISQSLTLCTSILNIVQVYVTTYICASVSFHIEKVVRIVDGPSPSDGRVEVYWNDQWGTICDKNFDYDDGDVICKFLGYPEVEYVYFFTANKYGKGKGPMWFGDMKCKGNEDSPYKCNKAVYSPNGANDCDRVTSIACQRKSTTLYHSKISAKL